MSSVESIFIFRYNIDIWFKEGENMPNIRPSADLRDKYNEISDFCHQYDEPVYITKNGTSDLVVMSIETYERLAGRFQLHAMLDKGLADIETGNVKPAQDVFDRIEKKLKK